MNFIHLKANMKKHSAIFSVILITCARLHPFLKHQINQAVFSPYTQKAL